MKPARALSTGPIATTVLEILSTLLAPELRARILREALELEGADVIPEEIERARAFVEGPLRLVVKRRVGPTMASFVIEALAPLFARIESSSPPGSGTAPTVRPGAAAEPRRPESGTIRVERNRVRLVLASAAPDAATGLSRWLRDDADVLALSHPEDVVAACATMRPPWWLVIDLCLGPIDPGIVTEIDLPGPGTRVLIWGELPSRFAHLLGQRGWDTLPATPEWTAAAIALRDRLPEARVVRD